VVVPRGVQGWCDHPCGISGWLRPPEICVKGGHTTPATSVGGRPPALFSSFFFKKNLFELKKEEKEEEINNVRI
jgi:hypothetical protein